MSWPVDRRGPEAQGLACWQQMKCPILSPVLYQGFLFFRRKLLFWFS